MALPWYSPEFPLNNPESSPKLVTTQKNYLWSLNSVRDILVKSNNLFKLPERETENISLYDDYEEDSTFHSGLINKAFLPMRVTLMAVGRWPFPMKFRQLASKHNQNQRHRSFSTRIRNYDSTLKSPLWIYFGLTTAFIFFVLVMSTVGFFDFFLNWQLLPGCHWTTLPNDIFHDNLVMFLLVWGCLVHGTVSSFSFLLNRRKVVRILNYWNVAADELLIAEVNSHRRFLIASNVGYLLFLAMIYYAYTWKIPLVRDGAALFGSLAILPLLPGHELKKHEIWKLRVFGVVTIIYAVYASRAFLFLFCFKCRLLRSLFRVWNSRLIRFLRRPEIDVNECKETTDRIERLESQRLLKDMRILLKMVKLTDKMFATVLQAYYAVQLLNMCFELYMLAKSGTEEFTRSDNSTKGLDIVAAVLTLVQNVYFFFTVSLDGAYVGEEAAKGLEALRCHYVSPSSSIHRKYLVYNLGTIYNQRIAVTGGKFFIIDRPFIITVLGAVLTYFVIILQVGPSLQQQLP
ncbi:unnamed protein product [Orchesella dallaii]|uniref:Gustatory receptor n=1 Tax=Orchesella dallaii TaxID=48710 RepID=A0ABP1QW74_9HEXA